MFTDGLDPVALEWVQGDLKKGKGVPALLTPPVVLSSVLARESVLSGRVAGRGWDLPPTQLHSPHFHSGLLPPQVPLVSPIIDDLNESVGSVSADGLTPEDSSDSDEQGYYGHRSVDSSPRPTVYHTDYERLGCAKDESLHEARAADEFYYAYDQRLLNSRPNSKSNSRCNSQRESFGIKETCQQNNASMKVNSAHKHAVLHGNSQGVESTTLGPLEYYQGSVSDHAEKFFNGDLSGDRENLGKHLEELEQDSEDNILASQVTGLRLYGISMAECNSSSLRTGGMPYNSTSELHCDEECEEGSFSGIIGASPSAPPMMGSVSIEASEDADVDSAVSASESGSGQTYNHNPFIKEESLRRSIEPTTLSERGSEQMQHSDVSSMDQTSRAAFTVGVEEIDSMVRQTATLTSQPLTLHLSGHGAWQALIAYDACVRLCLRAWSRGCIEAPEFLRDECAVLQNAFCLHNVLLQPQEDAPRNLASDDDETAAVVKPKSFIGKIKVQVRKVRIFPRLAFQGVSSQRGAAYVQAGAQYIRQVSDLLKAGVKTLRNTALETQEAYICLLRLKSTAAEEADRVQPGAVDVHVFHPQCSGDDLLLEVQDPEGNVVGLLVVPLVSLNDDQNDQVRWWPIYNEPDRECVGKVQLFISYSVQSNESSSSKTSRVSETVAYDTVLEVAMRAQQFQRRSLRLHGPWKWLLNEFAVLYGVSNVYASLRYVACIMEVATPTEDCLMLIHELLCPVLKAQVETTLSRQEKRMLLEVEDQVEKLVAMVFENYKSLDEASPSGMKAVLVPATGKAAPVIVPAVQIFTLLHDILAIEAQRRLCTYFQRAAKKRCRRHLSETDELIASNNEGFLMDSITMSMAYAKMKAVCINLSNEVRTDIEMHNQHILPSSIDLPSITTEIYSGELCNRLRAFLSACPPSGPTSCVLDLLFATANFQQDLLSWKLSVSKGSVDAKELFHLYIDLWIQDKRLSLLEHCKLDKVRWTGVTTSNETSPFVEEMYDRIKETLNEYDVLLTRWPEYTIPLETAVADVETAVIGALEKQFADVLMPLKDVMVTKKFSLQYMQKLTRRRSLSLYSVPNQLGIFLNTIKRLLDTLRPKMEAQMKSWVVCMPLESGGKPSFGERLNEVTVILRAKYKNFVQAIVEKLADNARLQGTTRLKKILRDTREVGGESDIRERMQLLSIQLLDTINHLHDVFSTRVFVAICRGYWDRIGQDVLHFLENRKENRSWYKGSYFALLVLDDIFASQMQKLQGHALQEKDLEPPRSVMEARSMLSKDAPNGLDSSNYFYF